MKFVREGVGGCATAIAKRIGNALSANQRVLWLVSGGSNITIEAQVMHQLRSELSDKLNGLAILPMDERYGPEGHKDSNTQQLRQAGFDPGNAIWIDVLSPSVPLTETVEFYSQAAATALSNAQLVVGQFGLGGDGHVAGILPGSPAADIDEGTVAGYEWNDYTRMTLTAEALRQISVAYVPAYGTNKEHALERLHRNDENFSQLPAKVLYEIPEVYIYTDNDILRNGR